MMICINHWMVDARVRRAVWRVGVARLGGGATWLTVRCGGEVLVDAGLTIVAEAQWVLTNDGRLLGSRWWMTTMLPLSCMTEEFEEGIMVQFCDESCWGLKEPEDGTLFFSVMTMLGYL